MGIYLDLRVVGRNQPAISGQLSPHDHVTALQIGELLVLDQPPPFRVLSAEGTRLNISVRAKGVVGVRVADEGIPVVVGRRLIADQGIQDYRPGTVLRLQPCPIRGVAQEEAAFVQLLQRHVQRAALFFAVLQEGRLKQEHGFVLRKKAERSILSRLGAQTLRPDLIGKLLRHEFESGETDRLLLPAQVISQLRSGQGVGVEDRAVVMNGYGPLKRVFRGLRLLRNSGLAFLHPQQAEKQAVSAG